MASNLNIEKLFKIVKNGRLDCLKEELANSVDGTNMLCRKRSGDSLMHLAARSTDLGPTSVEFLQYLVEDRGGQLELANLDGKTPLHDAAQFSNAAATEYLLRAGANVNAVKRADWTPLMLACTKDSLRVIKILLKNKADLFFANKDGWNSFHIATREGHLEIIEELLLVAGSIESREKLCMTASNNGRRPIHTAAMHGKSEIVARLLQEDCVRNNINIPDKCGTTALMDACRFGHIETLDLLVQVGADLHACNRAGMNCLHIAGEAGQTEVIEHLLKFYNLDINSRPTDSSFSCLFWAVKEGHLSTVSALLELGASTNLREKNGLTSLEMARNMGRAEVVQLLEKYFIS